MWILSETINGMTVPGNRAFQTGQKKFPMGKVGATGFNLRDDLLWKYSCCGYSTNNAPRVNYSLTTGDTGTSFCCCILDEMINLKQWLQINKTPFWKAKTTFTCSEEWCIQQSVYIQWRSDSSENCFSIVFFFKFIDLFISSMQVCSGTKLHKASCCIKWGFDTCNWLFQGIEA